MDSCHVCPTRRVCLAAGLERRTLTALADCVLSSAPMRRGDYAYRAGDPAEHCFVVRSGAYKTFLESADGDVHVVGFHFPGELLGLEGLADGVHRESAVALETSTACRFSLDDVPELWRIGSGRSLMRLVGQCEQQSALHQLNLSRCAADARVAGFLIGLGRRMQRLGCSDTSLPMPMSRTDLANHLGMTLECLSRVLGRLARSGVISASRTRIVLEEPEQLSALAAHLAG